MKAVIAIEGDDPSSDSSYILLPGSLVWKDEPIPVTTFFDYSKPPVGKAENLHREGDSVIAEITYFDGFEELFKDDQQAYSIYVSPFVCNDGTNDVVSAQIRGVAIIGKANNG